jgi:hypothetical protein
LDHEDPLIRRTAEAELRHRRRTGRGPAKSARPHRPPAWSELLDYCGPGEDFDTLWLHFERVPPELARAAGHFAVLFVPGFQTQVQVKLIAQHPADRVRALKLICDLDVTRRFCKEVFASANDAIPDVRAGAMRALGMLGDPTSRRILERGLGDAAPLVQAAAVEALDQLAAPRRVQLFLSKTESDDANVRAAAIHALLKMHVSKAAMELGAMLKDERPEHRRSALWVVDRLRLTAVYVRVADMAQSDPDPRVARIARHVQRRLQKPEPTPANAARRPAGQISPAASATVHEGAAT